MLDEIRERVRAHRRYPELARRRGITGRVRVAFRIAANGATEHVTVTRAVDPLLDEAALAAVRASSPLPFVDGELAVDLDFTLAPPRTALPDDEVE